MFAIDPDRWDSDRSTIRGFLAWVTATCRLSGACSQHVCKPMRFGRRWTANFLVGAGVLLFVWNMGGAGRAAVRVEAYRGEPFGMGRVSIDLPPGSGESPADDDRFAITEKNGRTLYPVVKRSSARPAKRLLRDLLGVELPQRAVFYFMFRGDEPLEITAAHAPVPVSLTVRPSDSPREFNELLDEWWEATADRYAEVFRQAEYPVVVENYLTATWARRLGRPMPEPKRYLLQRFGIGAPWLSQLMANETYQTEIERELIAGPGAGDDAGMMPLPAMPPAMADTAVAEDAAAEAEPKSASSIDRAPVVEPIAGRVPEECFYLRFGNFTNYLWFRDFLRHWQGDLGNMLVVESVERDGSTRFQQQIAVGETQLSRIMGPAVVEDVAIVGFDAYVRDGAAMGILFQAKNNLLLGNNLSGQRMAAKAVHPHAVEETLTIAGKEVSFVHSPDGRLRSYYAVDGDFHLVTNCRRLVERFLETGAGGKSLAASRDFQECRADMPLERHDTLFAFVPAAFFQNLAGPHYRIELDRRLRSVGEMRALRLARLAAGVEGQAAESMADLVAAELLPPGFGQRYDGSRLEPVRSAQTPAKGEGAAGPSLATSYVDSLRGESGWMVPIPDVEVGKVARAELRRLARFQQQLRESVGGFAPVCVAVRRAASPDHKEWDRITLDLRAARYSQMPLAKWPGLLGEAQTNRVTPVTGDAASLEIVLGALGDPIHVFGGLRDFQTPLVVRQGEVQPSVTLADAIRAYVGAWPKPELIGRYLGQPAGPLDAEGIGRTGGIGGLFDLWFRRADDFFLFSFQRDVLLEVGPQLAMIPAERPAQIRLGIADLSDKQVANTVNAFGYMRARDTSASASRFMNSLSAQLQVPPADARSLGESLVGGRFKCPLGGEYQLVEPLGGGVQEKSTAEAKSTGGTSPTRVLWASSAPAPRNRFLLTEIPADYQMPLLAWFRGLTADIARVQDELWLHANLEMTRL